MKNEEKKTGKNREKNRGKHKKTGGGEREGKIRKLQQVQNETRQDFDETRFPQDRISGNAENGREQKQGLIKCHKTTIRDQKQGLSADLVRPSSQFWNEVKSSNG